MAVAAGSTLGLFSEGVAPDWRLRDIYAGMMQLIGVLQLIGLALATWLPTLLRN